MSAPASTACQTGWTPRTTNAPSRRRCLRSASSRTRLISGFAALVITSLMRSVRLGCPAAVVETNRPEVAGEGDAGTPGDGGDGVHAYRPAADQAADGLGDRGEGLVFGELAQPGRHAGGGDEPAGQERQQGQEHGGVAGCFDALGG